MRIRKTPEDIVHEKLVEHYDKYYRLAYSYAGNQEDAMDIVQESACRAIMASDKLRQPEFADTWIYRIVINTSLEFLRKRQKEYLSGEALPEEGKEDRYREFDVEHALEQMEPMDRTIIILRYFEDLKLEQIAKVLDENVNTVKSRLYRTLKKLKLELAE